MKGCDSGIGHSLAKQLDRAGFHVFAGCLSNEGQGSKELRRQCSSRLQTLQLDVSNLSDVESALQLVQQQLAYKGTEIRWSGIHCIDKHIVLCPGFTKNPKFLLIFVFTDIQLWGIVNNAGICYIGNVEIMTEEDMQKIMAVNYMGPVNICKHFLPLIRRSRGRIVNVASNAG